TGVPKLELGNESEGKPKIESETSNNGERGLRRLSCSSLLSPSLCVSNSGDDRAFFTQLDSQLAEANRR
ncbi:MAG TPA: hypothetical protein VGM98_05065, partial [Schlesneria sp.]